MKQKLLLLFAIMLMVNTQAQDRFTTFNSGTAFTAITVDGENSRVWGGTEQSGIFKLNIDIETLASDFTTFSGGTNFDNLKVKSMAADKLGNVWIGHHGINYAGSQGGVDRINSSLSVKHYIPERNFRTYLLAYNRGDGIGNLKTNAITVDKNNTVWTAHHYRDILSSPNYFVMPGTLSYKKSNQNKFTTKGGWKNTLGIVATQSSELPYPAFTTNPPVSQTAQARVLDAISSDNNLVWVGMRGYLVDDGDNDDYNNPYIPNRVLTYRLDGTPYTLGTALHGGYSFEDMGFTPGGVIYAICANNEKGTWVAVGAVGKGFSVNTGGTAWTHIDRSTVDSDGGLFSKLLPENTRFSKNGMWHDEIGRVFIGTDKGLIVYNGFGDPIKANSYKIYTNYEFGGADNPLNIVDVNMTSVNITAGCANPNNASESWAATDSGILRIYIPIQKTAIYNIKDYDSTTSFVDAGYADLACIIHEDDEKLTLVKYIENNTGNNYPDTDVANFPAVAADGSNATVFRIYDFDPEGFYEPLSKYKFVIGPGTIYDIDDADYIKRYGRFNVRTLSSYPNNSVNSVSDLNTLGYVDIVYTHPEYIDSTDYVANEIFAKYDFIIYDVSSGGTPNEVFRHPLKVSIPPILLGHGVWSDISSLKTMETFFISKGFSKNYLAKAWRPEGGGKAAELEVEEITPIIPDYIQRLLKKAATHGMSAGKSNVIVHSRGGLYTRAYIEGIDPNYPYKKNVNSLITLNTPHAGAQGGNFALDKRKIRYGETNVNEFLDIVTDLAVIATADNEIEVSTIGKLIAMISDEEKVDVNGARQLLVENDVISGVVPPQDAEFIKKLNYDSNLSKLNGIPIHTISSEFDPCSITGFCNLTSIESTAVIAVAQSGWALLALAITEGVPDVLNDLTSKLYNQEPNDFIVPLSSMQAGLGSTDYNTHYGTTDNFPHINAFSSVGAVGITETPVVHNKLLDLLKSNVYDTTSTGLFSLAGINPPPVTYNLLADELSPVARNLTTFDTKILINRDPAIFDNVIEGDVLSYNIYTENADKILIVYENENHFGTCSMEIKENLNFQNTINYTIPEGYNGEFKITAYGFQNGIIGFVKSIVTFNIGIPSDVTLQNIHFENEAPVIFNQTNYDYSIIGTFSDGIDRNINNYSGLTFVIEETSILSQINNTSIKGETVGSTLLTATLNGFEDTILVKVVENRSLQQTIITGFYGTPNTDNTAIAINWETLREYENATFILETSYGTPDNFAEINQQVGNGTTETPAQFNFDDDTFGANTLIYYRIKMIDTQGNFTYSSTIEINLVITLGVDGEELSSVNLELYPNPAKTEEVTLKLDSKFTDKNAKLELYSLQGKRLSVQTLNVQEGTNNFKLKIGEGLTNGIYLVRISTTNYIKTVKLIVEK